MLVIGPDLTLIGIVGGADESLERTTRSRRS